MRRVFVFDAGRFGADSEENLSRELRRTLQKATSMGPSLVAIFKDRGGGRRSLPGSDRQREDSAVDARELSPAGLLPSPEAVVAAAEHADMVFINVTRQHEHE